MNLAKFRGNRPHCDCLFILQAINYANILPVENTLELMYLFLVYTSKKDEIMKKICIALATCATLGTGFTVNAADHSVTLGYAQSKFDDSKLKGVNLKYRYEWDSPISVITSLTYLSASEEETHPIASKNYSSFDFKEKNKNLSLSAGPAYRVSQFISIYGLMGININRSTGEATARNIHTGEDVKVKSSYKTTSLMYGAGIQANPMPNLVLDIGYERSSATKSSTQTKHNIGGFNIGAGYRF